MLDDTSIYGIFNAIYHGILPYIIYFVYDILHDIVRVLGCLLRLMVLGLGGRGTGRLC